MLSSPLQLQINKAFCICRCLLLLCLYLFLCFFLSLLLFLFLFSFPQVKVCASTFTNFSIFYIIFLINIIFTFFLLTTRWFSIHLHMSLLNIFHCHMQVKKGSSDESYWKVSYLAIYGYNQKLWIFYEGSFEVQIWYQNLLPTYH